MPTSCTELSFTDQTTVTSALVAIVALSVNLLKALNFPVYGDCTDISASEVDCTVTTTEAELILTPSVTATVKRDDVLCAAWLAKMCRYGVDVVADNI